MHFSPSSVINRPNLLHLFFERLQSKLKSRARVSYLEFIQYARMKDSNAADLNVGQSLQSILFLGRSIEDLCRATREINRVFDIMSREEHHGQKGAYRCFL